MPTLQERYPNSIESVPTSSEQIRLQFFDPNNTADMGMLDAIAEAEPRFVVAPRQAYTSQVEEALELRTKMEHVPQTEPALRVATVSAIREYVGEDVVTDDELHEVLEVSPLMADTARLAHEVSTHASNTTVIEEASRIIYSPIDNRASEIVGPEVWELLRRSRLVGLLPFSVLDRLNTISLGAIGGSAVAHALDGLVTLGLNRIDVWDGGTIDPSNIWRYPGLMGTARMLGFPKALALQAQLQARNPWGSFHGNVGKAVMDSPEHGDVTIGEIFEHFDLVSEVVDSLPIKAQIRQHTLTKGVETPILYIADTDRAISGIEMGNLARPFNQKDIDASELDRMADTSHEARLKYPALEVLREVIQIVAPGIGPDHGMQFMMFGLGFHPAWSQTPIAAHETSATTSRLLTMHFNGRRETVGTNYQSGQLSEWPLMADYTPEHLTTIRKTLTALFALPEDRLKYLG